MNTYTVIALRPDTDWGSRMREASYVTRVKAETPTLAARKAKRQLAINPTSPDDIEIIAVFEGSHRDQYDPSLDNQEYEDRINAEDNQE